MTHSTSDDNSVLLVHAYLDDELDPANALEIAQRMRADPALAAASVSRHYSMLFMSAFRARLRRPICGPASRRRSAVSDVRAGDRRGARSPHRSR
jgi:anti-sigma factor RsiW